METTTVLIITAIVSLALIVWGFYAVNRQEMARSERILWKVFFVLTPVITSLLFLILRRPGTR